MFFERLSVLIRVNNFQQTNSLQHFSETLDFLPIESSVKE